MLPIKLYVEELIQELAKEGIEELGQHGGYINLNPITSNPVRHTEGNALEFIRNFKVPYWYYLESDNDCTNCQFNSKMPELCKTGRTCITSGDNSIELQLEEYIKSQLPTKLNLDIFQSQGYELTIEDLKDVEVTIRDNDIIFYVEYPIRVKRDQTFTVKQFQIIEESDLTELYEIAYDLTNYQSNNCMIESHLLKELSEAQGLGPNQLPPISAATIGPGSTRIWTLPQVERQMKQKVSDAMQVIGIYNHSSFIWPTYNNPSDPNAGIRQALLDQRVFYPLKRFHDANIRFEYNPMWNPYIDITPNQGGALLPTELGGGGDIAGIGGIVGTRTYDFQYQYSFPTVVEIRKDNRQNNEQLFRFALEANVRGNRCYQSGMNIIHSTSLFPSLVCSEEEKTEPLTIDVSDDFTLNPVQGAEISYEIGNERCPLGRTDQNGILTTLYPDQNDGMIVINKEDYHTKALFEPDISASTSTKIVPIQEKNVAFKIIDANAIRQLQASTGPGQAADILNRNVRPPTAEDTIMLRVKRLQETPLDIKFDKVVNFIQGEIQPETLSLIPGTYNISIELFIEKEITLPEEHDMLCITSPTALGRGCKKTPVSPNCHDDDFEATTNPACYTQGYTCEGNFLGKACAAETPFDYEESTETLALPNGGVIYDEWQLNQAQLTSGDNIAIYLFRQDLPTRHHHMQNLQQYKEYSEDLKFAIQPRIE